MTAAQEKYCFFCNGCQRDVHHCFDGITFFCIIQDIVDVDVVVQICQQFAHSFLICGNHSGCTVDLDHNRLHIRFAVSRCCSAADYQYKYYDSKYSKMCFHFYLLERAVLPFEWESRGFRSSSLLYDRHELDSYAFSSSLNGGWSVVFTRGVVTSA